MAPLVTVIVCALVVDEILDYLSHLEADDRVEVIVGLQCATVEERDRLRRATDATVVIIDRVGLSNARNECVAVARGRWLLFPDVDSRYEEGSLAALCRHLSSATDDRIIGRMHWYEAGRQPASSTASPWDAARTFNSNELVVSRSDVRRLGGFDVRLGLGGVYESAEEIDLVFRALASGSTHEDLPVCTVRHPFGRVRSSRFTLRQAVREGHRRGRGYGALLMKSGRGLPYVFVSSFVTMVREIAAREERLPTILGWTSGRIAGGIQWRRTETPIGC